MKKTKTLDRLMVDAIREFRNGTPKDIRNIRTMEGTGSLATGWTEATFEIEFVEKDGGEYKKMYITVKVE